MTALLSPLLSHSLILVKLRGHHSQITLRTLESKHWLASRLSWKMNCEEHLSVSSDLETWCWTFCRDRGSKFMFPLYLLVFAQISCVLLRSLHIRKCWVSFWPTCEARLRLRSICYSWSTRRFWQRSAHSTWGYLASPDMNRNVLLVLYDSEKEVDFPELELLPPPPLYADTFWLPHQLKLSLDSWDWCCEEDLSFRGLPWISTCLFLLQWAEKREENIMNEKWRCWCHCITPQMHFVVSFVPFVFRTFSFSEVAVKKSKLCTKEVTVLPSQLFTCRSCLTICSLHLDFLWFVCYI